VRGDGRITNTAFCPSPVLSIGDRPDRRVDQVAAVSVVSARVDQQTTLGDRDPRRRERHRNLVFLQIVL